MFKDVVRMIYEEFSTKGAMELLYRVTSFHRIPGSPGLERVAEALSEWLRSRGVDVEIRSYPTDGRKRYYLFKSPVGWEVRDGSVELVRPERRVLHRFIDAPTVVATYSPPGDLEGEVIDAGEGQSPKDFRRAKGRIALVHGRPEHAYRLARKYGAIAVMFYEKRLPPDAVPYRRLPIYGEDLEEGGLIPAVAVSNKTANIILSLMRRARRPVVRIRVDSRYRENAHLPVVVATIEGGSDREVWLTAHLCHPSPGANDNASGVASLAEAFRSAVSLLEAGKLDRPKMIIKALWSAEYYGFLAYVKERGGVDGVVASFNLDMVGGSQERAGGTFTPVRTPLGNYSFINFLVEAALEDLVSKGSPVRTETRLKVLPTPYTAGSDHDVLNSFGVPAVMLINWPDKYYHSSLDEPANIDPEMLRIAGSAAMASAYFISSARGEEVVWLARATFNKLVSIYHEMLNEAEYNGWGKVLRARRKILPHAFSKALKRIGELYPEAAEVSERLAGRLQRLSGGRIKTGGKVYRRRFEGPLSMGEVRRRLGPEGARLLGGIMRKMGLAGAGWMFSTVYMMDGSRGMEEIYASILAEYGAIDRRLFNRYLGLLVKAGLIEEKPS